MKKLVLAEKPSVAKDLARCLHCNEKHATYYEGKTAIVTWAYGHLLTLKMPEDYKKEWQEWRLADLPLIPKHFQTKVLPKTKKQLQSIKQLAQRKDIASFVIATDAGREGELLARWILQYTNYHGKTERLWISSQTDKAIQEGFRQLKPLKAYDNLYMSAQARSEADWLIGLNVSRALSLKFSDQLSAGRVQTPTLAFVREREKQIECFQAKEQFVVQVSYEGQQATSQPALIFATRKEAEQVAKSLNQGEVVAVKTKERTQKAPLLYDLTSLQQEANKRYQFSAKKTLSLAQSLYERHKLISYPRTDAAYLPTDIKGTMKERLEAIATAFDLNWAWVQKAQVKQNHIFNNAKISDHYGLIPTETPAKIEKLTNDEWKIYRLICERFLNLFVSDYHEKITQVEVQASNTRLHLTTKETLVLGWKKESAPTRQLKVRQGEKLHLQTQVKSQMTTPPARLSEADLLKQMEQHHLGTPATRAEMIEKLLHIQYMERQQNTLVVTPKGRQLLTLVNPSLVTPQLTEEWELHLQRIEKGKESKKSFIHQMEKEAHRLVSEIKQSEVQYKDYTLTQKRCPTCGERLREKNTKQGVYYICSNQACSYRRRKEAKVSNHRCPQCHKKMLIIEGQKGNFFKCPTCSITEKIADRQTKNKKMTKREEKQLLNKYSQKDSGESALAAALKAAMSENK